MGLPDNPLLIAGHADLSDTISRARFWSALVLLVALLVPPLLVRIWAEERLLRETFGDEYEAYCRRTWRLIPGLY